ncbi:MAG: glucose-6-phosphate dehydrogenase assembly protein OpcA [Terriglobales bacterium]
MNPKLEWSGVAGAGGIEPQWAALREAEDDKHARALTLNLICRARDAADAAQMAQCLWTLGPRHPARVFLVAPGEATAGGVMRLRAAAQPGGSELIEMEGAPGRAASVVAPLLASDLPVVMLWRGGAAHANPEFQDWAAMSDRVLVDAHSMRLRPSELAALAQEVPARSGLSDLTWARLTPWRQLLCQGLEADPNGFRHLRRVDITAGHGRLAGESLAATLFAGWLAHLLQWSPQERLGEGALRLRDAAGGEVVLRFQPCPAEEKHGLLRRLVVVGGENEISVVIQHRGERLAMSLDRGGRTLGAWTGPPTGRGREEAETLGEELSIYGGDALYEQALERGLELLAHLEAAA